MKILISGNNEYGLSAAIGRLYPGEVEFASRATGYDLCDHAGRQAFSERSTQADVVVVCAALYQFQQTVLLESVSKACRAVGASPHIIVIGSTTDRVKNGKAWLYNAEKKALRDFSNTLAIGGVWSDELPKVSYISFGTLSNNQEKHPDRKCLDIDHAAEYLRWVIDSPKHLNINEISIDPMQGDSNYD
jgi:NADP-dependent 3-hydroxy acid dehydrogenase YdfG